MIPIDPSVTDGVCVFCGDPVKVAATDGDYAGRPIPASEIPENPVLVRMCDDCRADFERWKREADETLSGGERRSDA